MPRIDDYKNARKLVIEKLVTDSFDTILQRTGLESVAADQFRVPFLNRAFYRPLKFWAVRPLIPAM